MTAPFIVSWCKWALIEQRFKTDRLTRTGGQPAELVADRDGLNHPFSVMPADSQVGDADD